MSTSLRLAAFAAVVAVVFLLAFGAGRVIGPWAPDEPSAPHDSSTSHPEPTPHAAQESHDD